MERPSLARADELDLKEVIRLRRRGGAGLGESPWEPKLEHAPHRRTERFSSLASSFAGVNQPAEGQVELELFVKGVLLDWATCVSAQVAAAQQQRQRACSCSCSGLESGCEC